MQRIVKSSVTDALMEVMEKADKIEAVVILYQYKKDEPQTAGFSTDEASTVATSNYLVDHFKSWLFTCHLVPKEED